MVSIGITMFKKEGATINFAVGEVNKKFPWKLFFEKVFHERYKDVDMIAGQELAQLDPKAYLKNGGKLKMSGPFKITNNDGSVKLIELSEQEMFKLWYYITNAYSSVGKINDLATQ